MVNIQIVQQLVLYVIITALPVIPYQQHVYHVAFKLELKAIFIQMFAMLIAHREHIKNRLIILAKIVTVPVTDV